MVRRAQVQERTFRAYGRKDIDDIPQLSHLSRRTLTGMKAVAAVLPFRTNNYVVEELIDWSRIPEDPLFQLTFPQQGMLEGADFERMFDLFHRDAPEAEIQEAARSIQSRLNPHPAGQLNLNVPTIHGERFHGCQHKYRETVLFFPSQGQTCHAYCTYCFRWAQFVGVDELKFANREVETLVAYLKEHPEVHSVLLTGGDPLIMKSHILRRYIEPLLSPELDHVVSIRIGTKSTAYWPQRFLTDSDSDDLLRLFEEVTRAGKHLALMSHYSHPQELSTHEAQLAVRRIHRTGAVVRCQAPLIRHVNDDAETWASLWRTQTLLGAVPYYMFVERDTGPKKYFEVPLARAHEIFHRAYRQVSGLSRTVRGPSMSATPGKVLVEGVAHIHGEDVFALKFIQARNPSWVGKPFYARFDPTATWLDDLEPAFGDREFFYEAEMRTFNDGARPRWESEPAPRRDIRIFLDPE